MSDATATPGATRRAPTRRCRGRPVGAVDLGRATGRSACAGGMFGVTGTGDTSGFGGLVRPIAMPGAVAAAVRRLLRRGRRRARARLADAGLPATTPIEKVVVDRGELTFYVAPRAPARGRAARCATTPALRFELCLGVSGVHYPDDTGRELHVGLPPARR